MPITRGGSFDHLVGLGEQRRRHFKAEHECRLGIDDQLELGCLHDRQVGGLRALKDAARIDADLTIGVRNIGSVTDEPASLDLVAHRIRRGIAWRAARLASWMRLPTKKGSGLTRSASGRSRPSVAKAALISLLVLTLKTRICSPIARPAVSASFTANSARAGLAGLTNIATRAAAGTSSRRSSSRFATNSPVKKLMPVKLPPGRPRLVTRPSLTGSSGTAKTTGIVVLSACGGFPGALPPSGTITETCRRARSAASAGSLSSWFSAHRYS